MAVYKNRGGEDIGIRHVVVHRYHTAYRLPRGIEPSRVDILVCVYYRTQHSYDHIHFVGMLISIVYRHSRELRHKHIARMLGLPLIGSPDKGSVALRQGSEWIISRSAGVGHKKHKGVHRTVIAPGRCIEIVFHCLAGLGVSIFQLTELRHNGGYHCLEH